MKKIGFQTACRWLVLVWHMLIALLMMQVCRVVFMQWNAEHFSAIEGATFWNLLSVGFSFDAPMVAYGFICYILLMVVGAYLPKEIEVKKSMSVARHLTYFIPYGLILFMQLSDAGYYPFVLQRANSDLFSEFQGKNLIALYGDFIFDFWPLTLTFFAVLLGGILLYHLIRFTPNLRQERPLKSRLPLIIPATLLIAYLTIASMRSTFSLEGPPRMGIIVQNFFSKVEDKNLVPIVFNTPFSLFTDGAKGRFYPTFFSKEELSKEFTPYYKAAPLAENDTLFGSMRGRNVMFIILESMAKEYIGGLNSDQPGYPSYTPFIDSLLVKSLYAKYGFASGKRSVESLPAIIASLPTFGGTVNDEDWTKSNYTHLNGVNTGITTVLHAQGYHNKFYHGDEKGAMGFYDFLAPLGVEDQFTAEEFATQYSADPHDRSGAWGIDDLPFMQAMAKDMEGLKEPFCAIFFSLSNHYPYIVPKNYKKKLKEGTLPIHKTAQYCDDALRHFFAKAKESEWYENTLFVITCDHTNQTDQPTYNNIAGKAAAPIIFYDPQGKLKGVIEDRIMQHCDITPTLLYLMGHQEPILSYGGNIFDNHQDHYALNYYYDKYILLTKELTATINRQNEVKIEAAASYLQTAPGTDLLPDSNTQNYYSTLFKAIVQDHAQRVRDKDFSINKVVQKGDKATSTLHSEE